MENVQLGYEQKRNELRKFPIRILAHDIRGPTNVGSIFRVADAFGVEKVYLSGSSVVPPHPKIRKTSLAAERHVPYSYAPDAVDVVRHLRSEGCLIVSLEITSSSIDLGKFRHGGEAPICIVLGSERKGVPQHLLDLSDQTVHIPMFGHNLSLNVASACSIAVFELVREMASTGAHRSHGPNRCQREPYRTANVSTSRART